jgi:hypothetical protein
MKTFKLIALAVSMVLLGATVAMAVNWPAKTASFGGVNTYLNALHATDLTQLSKVKVVSKVVVPDISGDLLLVETWTACPSGWVVTGGGLKIDGNSDKNWAITASNPDRDMYGNSTWHVHAVDHTNTDTDQTITAYAVCET